MKERVELKYNIFRNLKKENFEIRFLNFEILKDLDPFYF